MTVRSCCALRLMGWSLRLGGLTMVSLMSIGSLVGVAVVNFVMVSMVSVVSRLFMGVRG